MTGVRRACRFMLKPWGHQALTKASVFLHLVCLSWTSCLALPSFPRDFDANLYLCEEAFGLLPLNTFQRLSETLLFYAYVFVLLVTVITASVVAFHNLR